MFFVLKNKQTYSYIERFKITNEMCTSYYDFIFQPQNTVRDFENATIHNACHLIWQNARLMGCRFHITQSWREPIQ